MHKTYLTQTLKIGLYKLTTRGISDTVPVGWSFDQHLFDNHQSTDSYSGNYSLLVGVSYGYLAEHVTLGDGLFNNWINSGIDFPYKPSKLIGYYKYLFSDNKGSLDFDTAAISILLKKNSGIIDTIGFASKRFTEQPIWTPFEILISDLQPGISPDSLAILINPYATGSFWEGSAFSPSLAESNYFYLDSLSFIYDNTVGLSSSVSLNSKYQVYPNPSSNSLKINGLEGQESITLLNLEGKTVECGIFDNLLDLTTVDCGIYVLSIKDLETGKHEKIKLIKY